MLDPPITQRDIDERTVFVRRDGSETRIASHLTHCWLDAVGFSYADTVPSVTVNSCTSGLGNGLLNPGRLKNMEIERRDRWACCQVLHGGEGPETTRWIDILGVHPITAEQAAECYAEERMGDVDDDRDYGNGDCMHVAVKLAPFKSKVFRCYKMYTVNIMVHFDSERDGLKVKQ